MIVSYLNRRDLADDDPVLALAKAVSALMPDQHEICTLINDAQKAHPCLLFARWAKVNTDNVCTVEDERSADPRTPEEGRMILPWAKFHTLILRGQHYSIRACANCGKWFYQERRHVRFDTPECKRQWETGDPKFKAARAAYMRRHRAEMKGE